MIGGQRSGYVRVLTGGNGPTPDSLLPGRRPAGRTANLWRQASGTSFEGGLGKLGLEFCVTGTSPRQVQVRRRAAAAASHAGDWPGRGSASFAAPGATVPVTESRAPARCSHSAREGVGPARGLEPRLRLRVATDGDSA